MSATETAERSAAEMRGLLRFAQGLGLDEATVWEIYEAVGEQAAEAGASDDDRAAEPGLPKANWSTSLPAAPISFMIQYC